MATGGTFYRTGADHLSHVLPRCKGHTSKFEVYFFNKPRKKLTSLV